MNDKMREILELTKNAHPFEFGEILSRVQGLAEAALQSQQPAEREPKGVQKSKLEMLKQRPNYAAHRDVWVIRVSFEGYKHCLLDRFGRVVWLSEAHDEQPTEQWVSCDDRVPSFDDADACGKVWAYNPEAYGQVLLVKWSSLPFYTDDEQYHHTHWMPTGLRRPEPPTTGGE